MFLVTPVFWMRAQGAVKRVVNAPRHKISVWAVLLFSNRWSATTVVLERSKSETGVELSIAQGSHGCNPNCVDFPVAAKISPVTGRIITL